MRVHLLKYSNWTSAWTLRCLTHTEFHYNLLFQLYVLYVGSAWKHNNMNVYGFFNLRGKTIASVLNTEGRHIECEYEIKVSFDSK